MSFLNPLLALGAAAFLVPLIIHILNRSRFRTIDWGAMHLLDSVIKVNHKRLRIEQLILLLVRCAIPILLALCLARPVLTGASTMEGDAPVSLVILLDNSYSMDAVSESGSHFEQAVAAAIEIISATGRGSEIAVIQTGGKPTPLFDQPVFDQEAVIRKLKQLQGGFGTSDFAAAIDAAAATLTGMSHAGRELIVISDFQSADWETLNAQQANAFESINALEVKPEITLLPIGDPVNGNVAVESLEFPQRAIGVDQPVTVRANLRNYGTTPYENARVTMRMDGKEAEVSQVSIGPNETTQVLFQLTFDKPGSHVMQCEIVVDDRLASDNRLALAISVWEKVNVLLVDGDPSNRPLEGETDFLSVALSPFTFGRLQLSDLIKTETVTTKELKAEQFAGRRLVVLANVSKLDDAQLTALNDYVSNGGALLVCAGNQIDMNWYRESMYSAGAGLLPLPFGNLLGKIDDQGATSHVITQRFDHPALELFNDPGNGDLSKAEIRQWYQLSTNDNGAADEGIEQDSDLVIMARLNNGDPLLVQKGYQDGVVVQMATACDDDWSDLPLRPSYVPLMQQLVATMASHVSPPRNIATGEPAVALLPPAAEGETIPETVSMQLPDGSRRSVPTSERGKRHIVRFENTQRPGVYSLTLPNQDVVHFAAETSRAESELSVLDGQAIEEMAEANSAKVVKTAKDYLSLDHLRRHGREVWKPTLAALLLFMFLEVFLQQRFARVHS